MAAALGVGALTGGVTAAVAEGRGLDAARAFRADPLVVVGDSRLVVEQFAGTWAVRAPHLVAPWRGARRRAQGLRLTVRWVPRAQNARADARSC